MNVKFNKFLATCFLASCVAFTATVCTSCGDDDDVENTQNSVKSADEAGRDFAAQYAIAKDSNAETFARVEAGIKAAQYATDYKNKDKAYQTAFVAAAVASNQGWNTAAVEAILAEDWSSLANASLTDPATYMNILELIMKMK